MNATPTLSRSEKKIHKIYKFLDNSSGESDAEQSENDSEYSDNDLVLDQEENLEGNRIIDVEILNQKIMSQLVCGLCHSNVSLIELDRQVNLSFIAAMLDAVEVSHSLHVNK